MKKPSKIHCDLKTLLLPSKCPGSLDFFLVFHFVKFPLIKKAISWDGTEQQPNVLSHFGTLMRANMPMWHYSNVPIPTALCQCQYVPLAPICAAALIPMWPMAN
jgi:hypothetical protein